MAFTSVLTEVIGFVATPHAVAAFSVIVNVVLWRAFRQEAKEKDVLYERYIASHAEIIGDYHEFAHALERYVEVQSARRDEAQRIDADREGA